MNISLGVGGLGAASVILGVDPLVLVSLLEVQGYVISGLNEGIVDVVVGWVVVQVLLGDGKGLELLDCVVIVSNLREGERLLVDIASVHLQFDVVESRSLGLVSDLQGSLEVLFVEGHRELIQLLVHFFVHLIELLLLQFFLSFKLLLLSQLLSLSLLLFLLCKLLLLSFLLRFNFFLFGLLFFLFGLYFRFFLSSLLFSLFSFLGFLLFFGFFLGLCHEFLLSLDFSLSLLSLHQLFLLVSILLLLDKSRFFKFESLLSFHLLLDLKHLKLGLGLSSRKLMLSLKSCEVGFGSSLLGSRSLCLLNSLSSQELLLHSFGLKFLSSFLLLKLLKLGSSSS